jgi:hypothetical protein
MSVSCLISTGANSSDTAGSQVGRHHHFHHFVSGETVTERLSNLPKLTQLFRARGGI